ncbi:Alpha-protein kinase 1-like [Quillaja saponaria]|uniref:Alpha-protein kinase 1-like n=1 Tax=Quillaja saponaria TaxID=32244 RepID=A0AAD7LJE5_QUISA|nr:Alpha-protein kinase 1-like [Quillaja saponaria]
MSMPVEEQPPPLIVTEQSYRASSHHDSVGPLVGVLVMITILGVLAVMIGRLCSGRKVMGYGQYDLESWAETKCSSCIDGRISPPLPRATESRSSLPTMPVHTHEEHTQEEQHSHQTSPANA